MAKKTRYAIFKATKLGTGKRVDEMKKFDEVNATSADNAISYTRKTMGNMLEQRDVLVAIPKSNIHVE